MSLSGTPRGGVGIQLNGSGGRARIAHVLEQQCEDVAAEWLEKIGRGDGEWPDLHGYLRRLILGLADVFHGRGWDRTQRVIDELAEVRVRAGVGLEQGLQRALLAGRHVIRPLCKDLGDECEDLLLEALHECVFRFSESYQGMRLASESERMHTRIIRSLIMSLEARDPYTKGHSISVAILSQRIAEAMGGDADPTRVYMAGLLHDVGKIGIPDRILLKPGPLTTDEWQVMKSHPVVGATILKPIKLYSDVVSAVFSHHENFDGSGYPSGIAGDDIPLIARILRVADSYDAMTTTRAHRPSLTSEHAVSQIRAESGTTYDPASVTAFLDIIGQQDVMSELSLASLQIDLGEFVL